MSERNKRPLDETESINNDNHNEDEIESDSSMFKNYTEEPMLEDEEMPTYISMSSSSKHDNSNLSHNLKQQNSLLPEDKHSINCILNEQEGKDCVILSEEESSHLYNDDENECTDSEDMNEMDLRNDNAYYLNEGIDTKYQHDYSDRASDDCILNNRLKQHYKERSSSLQDLNNCEHDVHTPYNKRGQSLNIFNHKYLNLQSNQVASAALHKTRIIPRKYQHVQSKVKQYIRDIKEQNRKSKEKHMKGQEFIINKDHKKNEDNSIEQVEVTGKTIKDYAKKVIKDLQREEAENVDIIYDTMQITDNNKISDRIIRNECWNTENVEYSQTQNKKCNEKLDVDVHMENNNTEMVKVDEIDNSNASCSLKITDVKSIRLDPDELQNFYFANTNTDDRLNAEITELKSQFRQFHQTAVAENMRLKQELDAVKKSLARYENENSASGTRTKVQDEMIAISTKNENTVDSREMNTKNVDSREVNNKASASSIGSVVSSIDHWAESACSPGISIKSPNLNSILSLDDSIVLTNYVTPKKIINPLSRTFVTSTRILQTLSNITQGKTRVESPLARSTKQQLNENLIQNQSQDQSFHVNCNSSIITSSKKRKATEFFPTFVQPVKIPHTSTRLEIKNGINPTDEECIVPDEHVNPQSKQEDNKNLNVSACIETEIKYLNDDGDNVKRFICKDDSNIRNGSFSMQAVEPIKDLKSEENRIQECGPYLLGNLEVRMSEVNGTINVWSKEINYESENENDDDIKILEKSSQKKTCRWPDRSQTGFNRSPLQCSTNKKQKFPSQYNKPNGSEYCNLSLNLVKASSLENITNKKHDDSGRQISLSEKCRSPQCQEKIYSCCTHSTETKDKKRKDSVGTQENVYKNRHVSNSKSLTDSIDNHATSNTFGQNLPHYNTEVPLIPSKRFNETTKMRQRRLSGKKVRGILVDLFKGCGSCHENNATNLNSRNMHYQKGSCRTVNDIPQIRISSPSKLICDTSTQDNNRCCDARTWRLEAQLEEIRAEMERMQSRLIAIVDMLHKLNSIDN
ncbi:uncharacterized protein LOC108625175 [Ceratina calcarata]|uniref:Uncharacterized protein LOC108625175 n=1 Tax=Ceratina calcarata TaxID=156304 RepID=A0AAJ7IZH1_9HYME|nr:uncharacterized protein LOC108625175 [Ceratina calcarata]